MEDTTLTTIETFIRQHPAVRLLGAGDTEEERRTNAFRFVNTIACDLRTHMAVNAGLLRAISGPERFVRNTLALKATDDTVEMHLIVDEYDAVTARVTFGDGEFVELERFADPDAGLGYIVAMPPPTASAPVPPLPNDRDAQAVPQPVPDVDLVALLLDVRTLTQQTTEILAVVLPEIGVRLAALEQAVRAVTPGTYTAEGKFLNQTMRFTLIPRDNVTVAPKGNE